MKNKNEESEEINRIMLKGSKCSGASMSILRSKKISKKVKIRIYQTVICLSALYPYKTWILIEDMKNRTLREEDIKKNICGEKKIIEKTY